MEKKGQTKEKDINDPSLLKQHNHGEISIGVGGLTLIGFKYSHIQKKKKKTGRGSREKGEKGKDKEGKEKGEKEEEEEEEENSPNWESVRKKVLQKVYRIRYIWVCSNSVVDIS